MLYEALLLFGVVFLAEVIFFVAVVGIARVPVSTLPTDRTMMILQQGWLFVFLGGYFVYFWHRGGQTLPMQTWRMRIVARDGQRITLPVAMARYALAWLWFVPGWYAGHALGLGKGATIGLMVANAVAWACTARFSPDGQFLHDRLAGTRLVDLRPAAAGIAAGA